MAEVTVFAAPLPFSNKQIKHLAQVGDTVAQIVTGICPYDPESVGIVVLINDRVVPRDCWRRVRPKEGTIVNVRVLPQGGKGKKNPLASILSIAVLVAAPMAGSALAASMGVTSTLGVAAFKAGVGIVGSLLTSALAPPPKPSNLGQISNPAESPTQFIEGASNSLNKYGVVPICLGTNRMVSLQAAVPYTETFNFDQYVRQLFTWGYGEDLVLSDLRIGETPIAQFDNVDIGHMLTGNLHVVNGIYSNDIYQDDMNVLLQQVDGYTVRATQDFSDEAVIDLTFPQGMFQYMESGKRVPKNIFINMAYSPAGLNNWTPFVLDHEIKASQTEALRLSYRAVFPSNGRWDIRVARSAPDTSDDKIFDKVFLTAIKSVRYAAPVNLPGLCGTAVRMRATDQLNGTIDQFNALISNRIPDYDAGSATWIVRATSNPASIFRYVLQGPANDKPLPDSKIDLAALVDWHGHCAAKGYSYNRVIDYETSVDEILRDVASYGAASPAIVDGKRTVVIDRVKDDIVQVVTPRNSWDYSGKMTYPDLPHAFRVQFRNAAKGFLQDERIVYDDGYDQFNATKFEALELQACTDSDLSFKTARRHIAAARLRPETHSFMMDVENLVALRGDRIKFEHDVPIVGIGDGRIKTVVSGATVTGFTIDDTITIPGSGTYYVRIRLGDGTQLYKRLVTVPGEASSFTFADPFALADSPAPGDLCYVVEAGGELDLIITRIEPQDDLSARITAVNYAPEIFTAESAAIPFFQSGIATPLELVRPRPPVLVEAQSGETAMLRNSDGTITTRAVFTLRNDNVGDVAASVKLRVSGTDSFTNANVLEASPERVVITGLEDGTRYDVHIRYKRGGGSVYSVPLQLNNFEFAGASGAPADITGFGITVSGETAFLKWNAGDDVDLSHYRIKFSSAFSGATWATAQLLEPTVYENRISLPFQGGTYLIKAVDRSGNESQNAAVIITYDPVGLKNVVELVEEDPLFSGVKDNVAVDSGGLVLADAGLIEGYYYFNDSVDLGGLYTSSVVSAVTAGGVYVNNLFELDDLFASPDVFGAGGNDLFEDDDLFSVADIFGIGSNAWEVQLQYRIIKDDPGLSSAWSAWTEFTAGDLEFWAIAFRIYLRSLGQNISPKVLNLSVTIDMPDRIERGEDLTVPGGGITITYAPPFMGNPSVLITLQDAGVDDKIIFVSKTAGGFTFRVYNTTIGDYVARTFDFIASGYGRKNT